MNLETFDKEGQELDMEMKKSGKIGWFLLYLNHYNITIYMERWCSV